MTGEGFSLYSSSKTHTHTHTHTHICQKMKGCVYSGLLLMKQPIPIHTDSSITLLSLCCCCELCVCACMRVRVCKLYMNTTVKSCFHLWPNHTNLPSSECFCAVSCQFWGVSSLWWSQHQPAAAVEQQTDRQTDRQRSSGCWNNKTC